MDEILSDLGRSRYLLWRHLPPTSNTSEIYKTCWWQQNRIIILCSPLLVIHASIAACMNHLSPSLGCGQTGRYGASLGGPLCDASKTLVGRVQLTSHESKTTQKAQPPTKHHHHGRSCTGEFSRAKAKKKVLVPRRQNTQTKLSEQAEPHPIPPPL